MPTSTPLRLYDLRGWVSLFKELKHKVLAMAFDIDLNKATATVHVDQFIHDIDPRIARMTPATEDHAALEPVSSCPWERLPLELKTKIIQENLIISETTSQERQAFVKTMRLLSHTAAAALELALVFPYVPSLEKYNSIFTEHWPEEETGTIVDGRWVPGVWTIAHARSSPPVHRIIFKDLATTKRILGYLRLARGLPANIKPSHWSDDPSDFFPPSFKAGKATKSVGEGDKDLTDQQQRLATG